MNVMLRTSRWITSVFTTANPLPAIRVELVRVDGRLVGRTASDRWNLMSMGLDMSDSRNQTDVKRARREWAGEFTFAVIRDGVVESPTQAEIRAFAA